MAYRIKPLPLALTAAGLLIVLVTFGMRASNGEKHAPVAAAKSALTVVTAEPQATNLPLKISANGNVAAWQETIIGTETNGLRLAEVRAHQWTRSGKQSGIRAWPPCP